MLQLQVKIKVTQQVVTIIFSGRILYMKYEKDENVKKYMAYHPYYIYVECDAINTQILESF